MQSIKNAIILVGYDAERTIYSQGILDLLADTAGIQERHLVWNGSSKEVDKLANCGAWLIQIGSNINHEFSGWQEGVESLLCHLGEYQYIIFANDTLARPSSPARRFGLLPRFASIIEQLRFHDAIGLIHTSHVTTSGFDLAEFRISKWICTGFFVLSSATIRSLGGRIDYSTISSEFIGIEPDEFVLNGKASQAVKMHVESWLTNEDNGWHKAMPTPSTDEDLRVMRKKAIMILNEMILSSKISQVGGFFYDPTVATKPNLIKRASWRLKRLARLWIHNVSRSSELTNNFRRQPSAKP